MGMLRMGVAKQNINDFNARVKRIKSPKNNSYYDPDLGMHIPKRVSRERIRQNKEEDSYLGAFIVSMIIGAMAVMFAEVMRIRYFALTETDSVVFYLEVFLSVWAVVMLSAMMNRRTAGARLAQIAGVAVMMIAGHNLIWRWPDQMAIIYTTAHVEQVMEATTQHSVVIGGNLYGL